MLSSRLNAFVMPTTQNSVSMHVERGEPLSGSAARRDRDGGDQLAEQLGLWAQRAQVVDQPDQRPEPIPAREQRRE